MTTKKKRNIAVALPYLLHEGFTKIMTALGFDVVWAADRERMLNLLRTHRVDIALEWQRGPGVYPMRDLLTEGGIDVPIILFLNWDKSFPPDWKQEGIADSIGIPPPIEELVVKITEAVANYRMKKAHRILQGFSGAQNGADQGFLDGCIYYGLEYSGYVPKGRKCEQGKIPATYENLIELDSPDYLKRTEANVVASDCTVIFSYGELEGGSLGTAEFAQKHRRPYLYVDLEKLNREQAVKAIVAWIREKCPNNCILNGAGSRASKAPGIQRAVELIIVDVLYEVNGFRVYPEREEGADKKNWMLRDKK